MNKTKEMHKFRPCDLEWEPDVKLTIVRHYSEQIRDRLEKFKPELYKDHPMMGAYCASKLVYTLSQWWIEKGLPFNDKHWKQTHAKFVFCFQHITDRLAKPSPLLDGKDEDLAALRIAAVSGNAALASFIDEGIAKVNDALFHYRQPCQYEDLKKVMLAETAEAGLKLLLEIARNSGSNAEANYAKAMEISGVFCCNT